MNFCILLDKKNLWIKPYVDDFLRLIQKKKNIIYDPLDANGFEFCFVLSFTRKIQKNQLAKNCSYFVIHASNLPEGKGFAPIQWQILEGKNKIVICLIELAEKIDSGRILLKEFILLEGHELYDEIRDLQAKFSIKLIKKFIKSFPNISPEEQKGNETIYKKRTKEDSKLNLKKNIEDQFNLLRITNNNEWPAYFVKNGKKYIIKIYKEEIDPKSSNRILKN